MDTDGDGDIDEDDRRIVFDETGRTVGITLREALEGIVGLRYYREEEIPSASLSLQEREESFSTKIVNGREAVWRIRQTSKDLSNPLKQWVVLTNKGIDATTPFGELFLAPQRGISLAFVQDLDGDAVTAAWEYIFGCSDTDPDFDGDGLTDWQEQYGGWLVDVVGRGSFVSYSSCARSDTDLDGIPDDQEANRIVDLDLDGDGTPDLFDVPAALDARNPDTDGDGVNDYDEINGYTIELRFPIDTDGDGSADIFEITVTTDPLNADTDGDSVPDGDELELGIDPTTPDGDKVFDDDGDGLRNFEENSGWTVTFTRRSTTPNNVEGMVVTCTPTSFSACLVAPIPSTTNADSDGDGLTDRQERDLGTHPLLADTDGDGLTDAQEVDVITSGNTDTYDFITNPLDADSDNDMRTDGEEVNDSWVVRVEGEDPYAVFSDPNVADQDLDMLVDGQERVAETDPAKADTDGDSVSDSVELKPTRVTNPLRPDQKVYSRFTNITVDGDCEPGRDGTDDFMGRLRIGGAVVLDLFHSSILDNVDEDSSVTLSAGRNLVLWEGQSFQVSAESICEEDDIGSNDNDCDGDDEKLDSGFTSKTYTYPVSSGAEVFSVMEAGDEDCKLSFTLTNSVIPD